MKKVLVGQRVRVFKGRSAPVGSEGVVFWAKVYRYGSCKNNSGRSRSVRVTTRIGIDLDGTRTDAGDVANAVWSYSDNVELVGVCTADEAEQLSADMTKRANEGVPF